MQTVPSHNPTHMRMYYNNVNVKDHTNTVKRERIQSQEEEALNT